MKLVNIELFKNISAGQSPSPIPTTTNSNLCVDGICTTSTKIEIPESFNTACQVIMVVLIIGGLYMACTGRPRYYNNIYRDYSTPNRITRVVVEPNSAPF